MEIAITHPKLLWFLLTIPIIVITHFLSLRYIRKETIKFANYQALERIAKKVPVSTKYILLGIRILTVLLLIFAVAGTVIWYEDKGSDYDLVLTIDISSSMQIKDFSNGRLESAKENGLRFIDSLQKGTEIGIVSFAGTSFVEQRLTKDYTKAKEALNSITIRPVGGTNIGEAIISASNLFMNEEKGKAIILLTDGRSNTGAPVEEAINYANMNNIIIHTIGIGTEEGGLLPNANVTLSIDEKELLKIANSTSGSYYHALNQEALSNALSEILTTSKRKIKLELSSILMVITLLSLLVEWSLVNTKYIILP